MTYTRNQPVPGDDLSISAPILNTNTNVADTVFGIDHYAFSNPTISKGFHNTVTTPEFITSPPSVPVVIPTPTVNPIFYAFQPRNAGGATTTNLGVLQYSIPPPPLSPVPTPVTHIQSTVAPLVFGASSNTQVFDFTGLTRALCVVYGADIPPNPGIVQNAGAALVTWNGTVMLVTPLASNFTVTPTASGTKLIIVNNSAITYNNFFWTLDFLRVS